MDFIYQPAEPMYTTGDRVGLEGDVPMTIKRTLSRWIHPGGKDRSAELEEFVRIGKANLARMSPAEVDEMTEAVLAKVDREQTLREVEALRERWKEQLRQRAPRQPE